MLVTTDFSALANSAIPYAFSVVAAAGSVKLLHVIAPSSPANPLIANYERGGTSSRRQHAVMKELRRQLRHLAPTDLRPGIKLATDIVTSSDAAKAIGREAARFGADLICLASHGRSGLGRMVIGSVAQTVVSQAPCPVLVVRPQLP